MPTVEWMQMENTIQKVCGIISIITNSFLIFLILTKSPPKLGSYKWLMLYTSSFELLYALSSFFLGPSMHNYGSVCMVFQDMSQTWLSHRAAEIFIVIYCSFFGTSMAIFAVHFMYRYGAVNSEFKHKYLSGAKQICLYIGPIVCGTFWGITCWIFMSESETTTNYLRYPMEHKFRLKIENCAYIALYFWPVDSNGKSYPSLFSFVGVGLMYIILGASFISVFYFGIRCYRYISKRLGNLENQSQASKSLQSQLFYSLILQSAIPCVLMYLPATIIFTCPMLNIDFDLKYPFIGVAIAVYPAIDPLPTILIIKSYRQGCLELIACRRNNQVSTDYSHKDASARPSTANNINNF
ncbi:unnamed protein product [Caenorhabditis brenneri]